MNRTGRNQVWQGEESGTKENILDKQGNNSSLWKTVTSQATKNIHASYKNHNPKKS